MTTTPPDSTPGFTGVLTDLAAKCPWTLLALAASTALAERTVALQYRIEARAAAICPDTWWRQ